MPTPSNNPPPDLPPRNHGSSCPDEIRSPSNWRQGSAESDTIHESETMSPAPVSATATDDTTDSRSMTDSPRPDSRSGTTQISHDEMEEDTPPPERKPTDMEEDILSRIRRDVGQQGTGTPLLSRREETDDSKISNTSDRKDESMDILYEDDLYAPEPGYDISNLRMIPTSPSSYLRSGSKFIGTQQSERQVYEVQVDIKYVDLKESFLCGYLRIQGLTEDNPTLTTYFEGEIIGSKYGFATKHESWGATEKIDLSHWGKFSAFRQYQRAVKKGPVIIKDLTQCENIFMRWKEHFLVPDHRVRTLNGASFEGFYYICFNQKEGKVSGIYFHAKSEKFQQLELTHVEDRGCFSAMEFR